jgi:vitamin B12 transporter
VFLGARARRVGTNETLRIFAAVALCSAPPAVRAQVPGELRGRVTDATAGRAIAGAQVQIVGHAESALTDVDGSFLLRGLDARRWLVRVRALGYVACDTGAVIANGRSTTLDVVLHPTAPRLDPVVIRSRRDTSGIFTFDRTAIERSGRRDVGELLQEVPGVVITQAGGPGSPSHISIRGSGANEVLVLIDGNPVNSPVTGNADLSRVNLETVDRVTILSGAQSSRYGSRALAGVVLIETRRAERQVSGVASIGAFGERHAGGSAGLTLSRDAVHAGAAVTGDHRDIGGDFAYPVPAVRGGGTARRANGDAQSTDVAGNTFVDGAAGSLQLRTEWQHESRGTPGSIVQPSVTGREHGARVAGGVDAGWDRGPIVWTANVDAARERTEFADPTPPFTTPYDDSVDARSVSARLTAAAGSALGSLVLGGEGRTLAVTSNSLAPNAPHLQRQAGSWIAAHSSRAIGDGTQLAADLAARADWDSFLDGAVVSPRAGLTLSRGAGSLSAFYGGGYAPPSLADQFFHEGVLVRPNPNLQPERVRDELEVRATVPDRPLAGLQAGGDAAVYRANVSGMILWQPDFRFIWSPSNFDVRRSGWEMSGHLAAPRFAADVRGSFSRSDVVYTGAVLTGQVVYRPQVTANAVASLTRWRTRAEWHTRYVGPRRTVPGSSLNVLDPYWMSDVELSRELLHGGWQVDATVGVENVFDRSAAMLVDYPFPGRSWTIGLRTRR